MISICRPDSADMCWTNHYYGNFRSSMTVSSKTIEEYKKLLKRFADLTDIDVFYPCWSLTALLGILPDDCGIDKEDGKYVASYLTSNECGTYTSDNPVDACVQMIIKLKELNLLNYEKE